MIKKCALLFVMCICIFASSTISEAKENANALTVKQQNLVTVSAFTAKGDLENLKPALNTALDNGVTVNELKEVMY